MTRKQYKNKVRELIIAVYNNSCKDYKLGVTLKQSQDIDNIKDVAKRFGSYEAAWNCDAMRWARQFYLNK